MFEKEISEGTLREILMVPDEGMKMADDSLYSFEAVLEKRDLSLNELAADLFGRAGCSLQDHVKTIMGGEYPEHQEFVRQKGWTLSVFAPDDPVECLFRDGEPIAAMYTSTRGGAYQSEGYIHSSEREFYASNIKDPENQWVETVPSGEPNWYNIAKRGLLELKVR